MSDQTSEPNVTPEPILELDPEATVNGHAEAPAPSRSVAKRVAAMKAPHHATAVTEPAPPLSIFERLADNFKELEEEETSLRAKLSAVTEAKDELLSRLGGHKKHSGDTVLTASVGNWPPAGVEIKRVRPAKAARVPVLGTLDRTAPKPRKRSGAKRVRRSKADIAATVTAGVDSVVSLLKKHKDGLRAEQIRGELKMAKPAWLEVVKSLVESKKVRKTGHKRSTVYKTK